MRSFKYRKFFFGYLGDNDYINDGSNFANGVILKINLFMFLFSIKVNLKFLEKIANCVKRRLKIVVDFIEIRLFFDLVIFIKRLKIVRERSLKNFVV